MLLTKLVLQWKEGGDITPDQALRLARELARLLDQIQTERLDFAALKDLAPERFAAHWQDVLDFLAILTEHWPKILADQDCIDPADRRNQLIDGGVLSMFLHNSYTARRGATFDATADVIAELGARPAAETMMDLGEIVAGALESDDPEVTSGIVPVVAPTVGDLGEVTYDVVGFADDSSRALRVHVFGQPEEGGEGFTLRSVEATDMCDSVRGGPGTLDGPCP